MKTNEWYKVLSKKFDEDGNIISVPLKPNPQTKRKPKKPNSDAPFLRDIDRMRNRHEHNF